MTSEPTEFFAGDSVEWTRSLSNYPSSSWTLQYVFQSLAYKSTIAAAPDGDGYKVEITPAESAKFAPGDYTLTALVVDVPQNPTKRVTLDTRRVTVGPDLPNLTAPLDTRTHTRRMLEAIEQVLEGRITDDVQNYTIMGRSLTMIPFNELRAARNDYRRQVRAEEAEEATNTGEPYGGKLRARFTNE